MLTEVNELVQKLAKTIREWVKDDKDRHDAIGDLTVLQGLFIVLENDRDSLKEQLEAQS